MRLAVVSFALALAWGPVACADGGHDGGPRVRRLVYWEKWTDFEGEAMDQVVRAFNAEQRREASQRPGYVAIEVERVTISRIDQKLLVASAGGNPPDVAGSFSYLTAAYADKGALTDLTPFATAAALRRDDYIPHFWDLGVYRHQLWSLPTTPAAVALHWNKSLFREAGLDPERPPRTIEELDHFAERLTRWEVTLPDGRKEIRRGYLRDVPAANKRLLQVGFLPTEPNWWSYGWGYFFGARLMSGDTVTANSPANVRAFEWVASYSEKLGKETVQRFRSSFGSFSSPQNPFLSGRLAMELQGVWMHNFIQKFSPGLEWGAAAFPPPADQPDLAPVTSAESDVLVIPKGSRQPAEAFEFIAFVQRPEIMEQLCLGQGKFSPLRKVSEAFWAAHPHPYIHLFAELAASPNAFAAPQTPLWNRYQREMRSAVDIIQHLSQKPETVLDRVTQSLQVAVDRDRAVWQRRAHDAK